MRKCLRKISKFYSRVIMKNIGIFIFIGLMEVLLGPQGWMPNENIYAISRFAADMILPVFLAYGTAEELSEHSGGVIAALASLGIVAADAGIGIAGGLLMGTVCGAGWRILYPFTGKVKAGFELLCKNLSVAVCGIILSAASYTFAAPILAGVMEFLSRGVNTLIDRNLVFLLNALIEPAKILFLNNSINYGVLIPMGMQQAKESGFSILFLLETNPGPGLGILLAMLATHGKLRREYMLSSCIQLFGGIHEIYFPLVLSNLWLVLPLIAGGTAGTVCFGLSGGGLSAPAAPGSLLTILLVAGKERMTGILAGILLSAAVSMGLSLLILKLQSRKEAVSVNEGEDGAVSRKSVDNEVQMKRPVHTIGFICDGGIGSSAMGAALLRRKLKEKGMDDIEVGAYAGDMIPEQMDLLVCQKDYLPVLEKEIDSGREIYAVESLLDSASFDALIEMIREAAQSH